MDDKRKDFLIRYAHDFAPFIVARTSGSWIETTEGDRILDFTSGQICSTIGHNHPQIVAAVQRSLEDVIHLNSWMLSEPVLALAARLVGLVPSSLDKVILVNTGGEANEVALRLAKMHTGRFEIVGLTRSWHGLQAGVASLNLAGGHAGYGPLMPGTLTLPAPHAYRCPIRHCNGSCDCSCLECGFELIDQQSVGALCAVIAEPVLSAGGIIVPPPDYFQRLLTLCDEHGMLLILDEAQTGFGRLGAMFGFELYGIEPDILSVSKTLVVPPSRGDRNPSRQHFLERPEMLGQPQSHGRRPVLIAMHPLPSRQPQGRMSPMEVVIKELQADQGIKGGIAFGEGVRLAREGIEPIAQGAIESFDMHSAC